MERVYRSVEHRLALVYYDEGMDIQADRVMLTIDEFVGIIPIIGDELIPECSESQG